MLMDDLPVTVGDYNPATGEVRESAKTAVRFYRGSKRDVYRSKNEGRPVELGVDYVEIRQFGEKDTTIQEVDQRHKDRWPVQWARYQAGREQVQDGIPLAVLFPAAPEVVATLKLNNIHTVEALAACPDTSNIPFVSEHKRRAKNFLEGAANKGARFSQLESQLAEERRLRTEQADTMKALMERLAKLEAAGGKDAA